MGRKTSDVELILKPNPDEHEFFTNSQDHKNGISVNFLKIIYNLFFSDHCTNTRIYSFRSSLLPGCVYEEVKQYPIPSFGHFVYFFFVAL